MEASSECPFTAISHDHFRSRQSFFSGLSCALSACGLWPSSGFLKTVAHGATSSQESWRDFSAACYSSRSLFLQGYSVSLVHGLPSLRCYPDCLPPLPLSLCWRSFSFEGSCWDFSASSLHPPLRCCPRPFSLPVFISSVFPKQQADLFSGGADWQHLAKSVPASLPGRCLLVPSLSSLLPD